MRMFWVAENRFENQKCSGQLSTKIFQLLKYLSHNFHKVNLTMYSEFSEKAHFTISSMAGIPVDIAIALV